MQRSAKNPFLLNEPESLFKRSLVSWKGTQFHDFMYLGSIDRIRKIRFLFSLETATNNIQGYRAVCKYLELGSTTQSALVCGEINAYYIYVML